MYYTSSDVCQSQGPVWLISQGQLTATIIEWASGPRYRTSWTAIARLVVSYIVI